MDRYRLEDLSTEASVDTLYCQYVRFMDENGSDIVRLLRLLRSADDVRCFREMHVPLSRTAFEERWLDLCPQERAEFHLKIQVGYECAKRTWARDMAERLAERISGE